MPHAAICPECGQRIPLDARTHGLCPRCLLGLAMGPADSPQPHGPRFPAPALHQLAPHLPQYDIRRLVGEGGMAAVYLAHQRSLNRPVAIKILPRGAADPAGLERFAQEARVLATLAHPNIVAIYDFGQCADFRFLVMEFVPGGSLRAAMNGPLPQWVALQVLDQVADALEHAHSRGIVHRDIKPENILLQPGTHHFQADPADPHYLADFLSAGGRVRVADFGLAKLLYDDPRALSLTADHHHLGTPYYMAPEQRNASGPIDGRADIYAAGVLLCELLTGQVPTGRFPLPSQFPGIDARLDAIVLRCLETDPALRFPSIAAFRHALSALASPRRTGPRPALLVASLAGAAILGILLVAAGLFAWRIARSRSSPAPSAPRALDARVLPPHPAFPPWNVPAPFGPGASFEDRYNDLIQRHGADRAATLQIDRLPGDVRSFILDRLKSLTGGATFLSSGAGPSMTVHLAPVTDLRALADAIDFGVVREIDPQRRLIRIDASPDRLPRPLPPAIINPRDPDFYPRNLADLSCWDASRRRDALRRLKAAPSTQLRQQITDAIAVHLADADPAVRRDALDAYAAWAGSNGVTTLIDALRDEDWLVRKAAIAALGRCGDPRAADALVDRLETERADAAAALRALGPRAEPAVLRKLAHPDLFVRLEAIRVLADIATPSSLPAIEAAAVADQPMIQRAAAEASARIRSRQQPPPATAPANSVP